MYKPEKTLERDWRSRLEEPFRQLVHLRVEKALEGKRLPPGAPNRKSINREIESETRTRIYSEVFTREVRAAINKEIAAGLQRHRSREARRRAANPVAKERRRIFARLRKLGFSREYTSGKSAYYSRGPLTVRISDHEVPVTPEREWNLRNGGRSWADSRFSFIIGDDFDEFLREAGLM